MAFVRWHGNSATLLATVYEREKSRQVLLAAVGYRYRVSTGGREDVTTSVSRNTKRWIVHGLDNVLSCHPQFRSTVVSGFS